jgi:hypothetical protein
MCLTQLVVNPISKNMKKRRVYKIVKIKYNSSCVKDNFINSVFNYYLWGYGKHTSTRKTTDLDYFESTMKKCYDGFHVFLDRKTAIEQTKNLKKDGWGYIYILTCIAYGKDYVCEGQWDNDKDCKCAVYTNLTVEKREHERTLKQNKE